MTLRLRPARASDTSFLLVLRNSRAVREQSRHTHRISPKAHRRWLTASLADHERRRLYIACQGAQQIGTGRLDRINGGGEVSLALTAAARGQHLARPLILALIRRLRVLRWGPGARAVVRRTNTRSWWAFTRAGFELVRLKQGYYVMERRL